ncbi:MAG: S41 family peptidase [Gemmatimonadaceae bacterium]|nr:S41 family peptidase [Gemmatimonadaceae bacterium]
MTQFAFPDSRIGAFAAAWFASMNTGSDSALFAYDPDGEWRDHLALLKGLSTRVEGFTPVLVSYETDDFISIYSREHAGGWVQVNLGLDHDSRITSLGVRKSVEPVDYPLRTALTFDETRQIVEGIGRQLSTGYVVPRQGATYAAALRGLLDSRTYRDIRQGDQLADALTRDLVALTHDKHLQVIPPSRIKEVAARFGASSPTDGRATDDGATGHGSAVDGPVIESRVLEGNVGLITVQRFVDDAATVARTRDALSQVSGTRAVIIDLRASGGGDAAAVADLLLYFFTDATLDASFPALSRIRRSEAADTHEPLRRRLADSRLYVLTSSRTISAAEAFAYHVKQARRGTLVGEQTAGAGYRVDVFELPFGFRFVNSIASDFDADGGEGWQGRGVAPDVRTTRADALTRALSHLAAR